MTGRFESSFLKLAWLVTLLGILCPAPNAGFTLRFDSDVRVPVCGSISLQQFGQLIAAASTTTNLTDGSLRNRTSERKKTYAPLPEGYAQYLNSTVAYKVYTNCGSWTEAKELCEKDGARLAIADNTKTYAYFQSGNELKTHIGIYRSFDKWISVRDGSVVNNIPWASGEPDMNHGCVRIQSFGGLLETVPCEGGAYILQPYVCELPIPENRS